MSITPDFHVAHATATQPSSPPYTPTNLSPTTLRRSAPNGNLNTQAPRNILPLGGNKFSYIGGLRANEFSPQSSSDDDDEEEEDDDDDTIEDVGVVENDVDMAKIDVDEADDTQIDDDDDDDDDDDEVEKGTESKQSSDDDDSEEEIPKAEVHATSISISMSVECFTGSDLDIESCSSDYSADEEDVILQPSEYEYPPSDSSQSESLVRGVQHMSTFDSDESSEESSDDEFMANLRARRANQRLRRMTSGSISKRTISERGSDSDVEDLKPYFTNPDGSTPGIENRRIRRKMDRHKMDRQSISLLHPHFESIREVNENSDEDIDPVSLLNELPYWFMEVDE